MLDFRLIPILGRKIEANLPNSWTTHAHSEVSLERRVIRIFGPARKRNLFGPPNYAKVYVYSDKVEIFRVPFPPAKGFICTDAEFDQIIAAVKASTPLPVEEIKKEK
ncbi:TPA: hypothetical protein DIU27_05410 [Candidatus Collierbacteria bacterium]|uniref:Uncharacterized protein n=1 Tax=Candidatus Collierbacteria bacterium GW2011_GWB2_44_22 TaxID=1618387 RepID=A0A0G1HXP2_9BACT|nr:MAG: hypothetical protein UW31_C0002G0052 [Candidatus Collierbacteria bacterium GW2011_GWA2_44_13]KKT51911.1 MAG: hypothetical protein UW44_C0006G0029 [Candidatus Collierbacteria bacterium GW2011_GWB2_44_22]KKT61877.1 MAG: hypothetical protein UW56_C0016G0011 [Candidatus Collierbacteria bacterium GW2011_GWD1_44_27]KKT66165.1 MAG: hypothetical protein UW58_C0012G0007 [Candidatus Collierbacteria bacterium GW2011_GWC2_44_30]KKT68839.1 MAG: hypothetical protein UW64_C0009G0051 [Microgenomates gr